MAVYVDRMREYSTGRWCHMWSDDIEELHDMARLIGLRRAWFQDRQHFPHYDLRAPKRDKAIRCGAIPATRKMLVEHVNKNRQTKD